MIGTATAGDDEQVLGRKEDSNEMIVMERAAPLFSKEVVFYQSTVMIGTATAAGDKEVLVIWRSMKSAGGKEDSDETIVMERAAAFFSKEVVLDQRTGMTGTATAADDKEVLVINNPTEAIVVVEAIM